MAHAQQTNEQPATATLDELEEVHGFCANANAEASREGKPHAAQAYARVMKLVREIQARRT